MDARYLADVNAARTRASEVVGDAESTFYSARAVLDDPESNVLARTAATQALSGLVEPLIAALDDLIGETSWDD